jgi:hypothetical protein
MRCNLYWSSVRNYSQRRHQITVLSIGVVNNINVVVSLGHLDRKRLSVTSQNLPILKFKHLRKRAKQSQSSREKKRYFFVRTDLRTKKGIVLRCGRRRNKRGNIAKIECRPTAVCSSKASYDSYELSYPRAAAISCRRSLSSTTSGDSSLGRRRQEKYEDTKDQGDF